MSADVAVALEVALEVAVGVEETLGAGLSAEPRPEGPFQSLPIRPGGKRPVAPIGHWPTGTCHERTQTTYWARAVRLHELRPGVSPPSCVELSSGLTADDPPAGSARW